MLTETSTQEAGSLRKVEPDLGASLLVPFQKAIRPYLISRNDGDVCLECFCFFSRASPDFTFHSKLNTMRISVFVKLHQIKDFESFASAVGRLLFEKNIEATVPSFGLQECVAETRRIQELLASMSTYVDHL